MTTAGYHLLAVAATWQARHPPRSPWREISRRARLPDQSRGPSSFTAALTASPHPAQGGAAQRTALHPIPSPESSLPARLVDPRRMRNLVTSASNLGRIEHGRVVGCGSTLIDAESRPRFPRYIEETVSLVYSESWGLSYGISWVVANLTRWNPQMADLVVGVDYTCPLSPGVNTNDAVLVAANMGALWELLDLAPSYESGMPDVVDISYKDLMDTLEAWAVDTSGMNHGGLEFYYNEIPTGTCVYLYDNSDCPGGSVCDPTDGMCYGGDVNGNNIYDYAYQVSQHVSGIYFEDAYESFQSHPCMGLGDNGPPYALYAGYTMD